MYRLKLLLFFLIVSIAPGYVFADCIDGLTGEIIELKIKACREIDGANDKEVLEYAGEYIELWNLKKAYTGALISDSEGIQWMYTSESKKPCKKFKKGKTVMKRGYTTCCDTGRWGKCVFGGNWLGDIDGKEINSFQ